MPLLLHHPPSQGLRLPALPLNSPPVPLIRSSQSSLRPLRTTPLFSVCLLLLSRYGRSSLTLCLSGNPVVVQVSSGGQHIVVVSPDSSLHANNNTNVNNSNHSNNSQPTGKCRQEVFPFLTAILVMQRRRRFSGHTGHYIERG